MCGAVGGMPSFLLIRGLCQHAIASSEARTFNSGFVRLHYIAKNLIHLKEASDAILQTVKHMIQEQSGFFVSVSPGRRNASSALRYQQNLFESVNLRAVSMEKRMQNVINLVSSSRSVNKRHG